MTSPDGRAQLDAFIDDLARAPARVLLVDFDGTLAPFHVDRDAVTPYPGVREAMKEILSTGKTRVVVISGREVRDLQRALGVEPPPELWGTHGWERLERGGPHRLRNVPGPAAAALQRAVLAVAELALGERIEKKPASLALHVRGLPAEEAERILAAAAAAWQPLLDDGIDIHPFEGGIELRVRGWDKGDAVGAVVADEPEGAAAAYLGDDLTDEDAFRALNDLGEAERVRALSVLVRTVPRDSLATARLRPPEELLDFLLRWCRATT